VEGHLNDGKPLAAPLVDQRLVHRRATPSGPLKSAASSTSTQGLS
jgi:hypothetical protein